MNKLAVALGMYVVIAVLAWNTLPARVPGIEPVGGHPVEMRHLVVLVLAALAVLTWVRRHPARSEEE